MPGIFEMSFSANFAPGMLPAAPAKKFSLTSCSRTASAISVRP